MTARELIGYILFGFLAIYLFILQQVGGLVGKQNEIVAAINQQNTAVGEINGKIEQLKNQEKAIDELRSVVGGIGHKVDVLEEKVK